MVVQRDDAATCLDTPSGTGFMGRSSMACSTAARLESAICSAAALATSPHRPNAPWVRLFGRESLPAVRAVTTSLRQRCRWVRVVVATTSLGGAPESGQVVTGRQVGQECSE